MDRNCVMCDTELRSAMPETLDYQPYSGGYIKLTFCFGSTKFDNNPGYTDFNGFICDDCAEKLVPKMEEVGYDFHGNKVEKADGPKTGQ